MVSLFRPTSEDLERIRRDVSAVSDIQARLLAHDQNHLKVPDRVAHQYQIAGSKVLLRIASELPENLAGVGLFQPDSEHVGIGRVSTGLGCPHVETRPDFLGLRLAFQTRNAERVDFIAINDPGAPTDTHVEFIRLLEATAEGAGERFFASSWRLLLSLSRTLGALHGGQIVAHVLKQTARTAISSTAYQTFWTGIVEAGGIPGKFVIEPISVENGLRAVAPSDSYLSDEWRARQRRGTIEFNLHWIPFVDDKVTSLVETTKGWEEHRHLVGNVVFPHCDPESVDSWLWAALAAEMGANPGYWIRDRKNTIPEPSTEFEVARKIAYAASQKGRHVLPESVYTRVFLTGTIEDALAEELGGRRAKKRALCHLDCDFKAARNTE